MSRGALLAGVLALALTACEITVCELAESDNRCEADGDCLLAFCGTNCCPCEIVVSRRQLEGTYCMVTVAEGFAAARSECREARETVCEDVVCTGMAVCPHPSRARCEAGRCVAAYD